MRIDRLLMLACVFTGVSRAEAYEFRCRFVERVGNVDVPLQNDTITVDHRAPPRRVRVQFGVFDDPTGPAPAGGFVGWNVGTIEVSGSRSNAVVTRTPGRLAPFNFFGGQNANGNPPLPGGDPFVSLSEIDATLGLQTPLWNGCDAGGNPVPPPPPVVRGLNSFVSVYEISVAARFQYFHYDLNFGGNLIGATEWRTVGTPIPPNCDDPENPEPGSVTYAPFPTSPVSLDCTLHILSYDVPGPGAAAALAACAGLTLLPRRRSRSLVRIPHPRHPS